MKTFIQLLFLVLVLSFTDINAQWVGTNGPFAGAIRSLTILDTTIIAGTSNGIFISTNKGKSWNFTLIGNNIDIQCMTVLGADLYAGGVDGLYISKDEGKSWGFCSFSYNVTAIAGVDTEVFAATNFYGVFRITNEGNTWTPVLNATVLSIAGLNGNVYAGTTDGILISTNSGSSWSQFGSGLTGQNVNAITMSINSSFAGTSNGLYLSNDLGQHWSRLDSTIIDTSISSLFLSSENLYVGTKGKGIFQLASNGTSIKAIGSQLNELDILSFAAQGLDLYAGTDRLGIFYSNDDGVNWDLKNAGLSTISVRSLVTNGNMIFAGTYGYGVFLSTNNGASWNEVDTNLTNRYINVLGIAGKNLLAGTLNGIFHSTDNGVTWVKASMGVSYTQGYGFISNGSIVYAGTNAGIYRSTDSGKTWIQPPTGPSAFNFAVQDGDIFAGTYGGIYVSTDSGNNWNHTSVTNGIVASMVVNGNGLYAGFGDGSGVYVTFDNGLNWEQVVSGLTNTYVTSLAATEGILFASAAGGSTAKAGVFVSSDNGENWSNINAGMPDIPISYAMVNDLVVFDASLFAATEYGVWRRPLSEVITSVEPRGTNIPNHFYLQQNYPNPFNPSTTIEYNIPKAELLTIKVYNVLGQEIKILFNEEKPAGSYQIKFDGSNLASGIYFYRIQAGDFSQIKKMVLMK